MRNDIAQTKYEVSAPVCQIEESFAVALGIDGRPHRKQRRLRKAASVPETAARDKHRKRPRGRGPSCGPERANPFPVGRTARARYPPSMAPDSPTALQAGDKVLHPYNRELGPGVVREITGPRMTIHFPRTEDTLVFAVANLFVWHGILVLWERAGYRGSLEWWLARIRRTETRLQTLRSR